MSMHLYMCMYAAGPSLLLSLQLAPPYFFSFFLRQFKLINFNFKLIYGLRLLLFINSYCDTNCFIRIYESIMFSCRKNFYIAVFCKCW